MITKSIYLFFHIYIMCCICLEVEDDVFLYNKKRSPFLENYRSYADLAISQVYIPTDVLLASFKISAESLDLSIFGCSVEDVHVFAKRGSIPTLNPDNSKNPKLVRNITSSKVYGLQLTTDKSFKYINITSPDPGLYYIVAYFPYVDPDHVAVKQKGLSQHCTGFINIWTYISLTKELKLLTENQNYRIQPKANESYYYQFLLKPNVKEVILRMKNTENSFVPLHCTVRMNYKKIPSKNSYIYEKQIDLTSGKAEEPFWLIKDGQYYLELNCDEDAKILEFSLDVFDISETLEKSNKKKRTFGEKLNPFFYKGAVTDYYRNSLTSAVEPYTLYEMVKESGTESFLYTFNINHENENDFMVPIPLNLTSSDFSVLKFQIEDIIDVGGSFEFSLHFHPISSETGELEFSSESVDQIVIGCISPDMYETPTLPRHCTRNGVKSAAPIVLNNTIDNSTILIPFPESGDWYVSIQLFCKPCQYCSCYKKCSEKLKNCVSKCKCDTVSSCSKCSLKCKNDVRKDELCKSCNCDDNCADRKEFCKSSVMFDLSSFPCLMGRCGPNGRCQFMVADGYIFSACSCRNNYRGMDCTDDSKATPYWKVVLAQVLLITSNVIMIPCIYFAIRRKYYPEAVIYFFVFLFSSFYHACDVSDDSIQFCLTSHSSLQFGDFFTALLAIWGTMLAIADVGLEYRATLTVFAAIILGYCTVIDKRGIWIFLIISVPGLLIIAISWYLKYRKSGKSFVEKKYVRFYFSSGFIIMVIGIVIYAFLQTSGNYMYLHSLWHCIVGVTVLLVLPRKNTFPSSVNL